MTMNFRPVSLGILSGALMIVGSSMAFANPDQTNPRENALTATCSSDSATNCKTVSQDTSVTSDSSASTAAAGESLLQSDHDFRKHRNRAQKTR